MTRPVLALGLTATLTLLPGCPFTISGGPLEGTIAGEDWAMEQGEAWYDEAGGTYAVELYPELYVDCLTPPAGVSFLRLTMPDALGEYDLDGTNAFTFEFVAWEDGGKVEYDPVRARIEVIEVNDEGVSAGVHAQHSDDLEVDGRFEVPLCE